MADFYQVLGVAKGADDATIKSAYRKLAMKYHPDRNPDDKQAEQKFKEINEAYDVLKDKEKRQAYDRFGHDAYNQAAQGGGNPGASGFGGFQGADFGDIGDIFEHVFGGFGGGRGSRSRRQSQGQDLEYNLEISLKEAYTGKTAKISIPGRTPCDSCNGSGAKQGSQPQSCTTCGGRGKVRMQQGGFFTIESTCPDCRGEGKIIKDKCPSCRGGGYQEKQKNLSVKVPAGVESGMRIRLSGEGYPAKGGGNPGDLYIVIFVKPDRLFERDGHNLHCQVPISMARAALGGAIETPNIDGGRVKVTIPEGVQSGEKLRLRGKGMSIYNSHSRGDLYIHLKVETPKKLSKRQRELLEEFDKESQDSPDIKNFFKRAKDFWDSIS